MSPGQQASAVSVTFVENLSQANSSEQVSTEWIGSSFTTGSGSYKLEYVTLLFQENAPGPNLFVSLYSNDSGLPGTQITSFTNPASITTTLANNTFTLTTPQALTANTTYWLISGISSAGSGSYAWGYTNSFDQTGLSGWTIGDGGVDFSLVDGGWITSGDPYQFSVNGTETPVPEPLTILGTGVVLGGIPILKKEYAKRKKKKGEDA